MAKEIKYKKVKSSVWSGNGVGDCPASWGVMVDGVQVAVVKGRVDYAGRSYVIVDNDGELRKDLHWNHKYLRDAKRVIEAAYK